MFPAVKPSLASSVLLLSLACASQRASTLEASSEALPFIENDYARALTDARARNVPMFVDTWAPW